MERASQGCFFAERRKEDSEWPIPFHLLLELLGALWCPTGPPVEGDKSQCPGKREGTGPFYPSYNLFDVTPFSILLVADYVVSLAVFHSNANLFRSNSICQPYGTALPGLKLCGIFQQSSPFLFFSSALPILGTAFAFPASCFRYSVSDLPRDQFRGLTVDSVTPYP